jgi:hypothetical protein
MYGDHSDVCYIWNYNPAFGEADAFLLSASEPVGVSAREITAPVGGFNRVSDEDKSSHHKGSCRGFVFPPAGRCGESFGAFIRKRDIFIGV